MTTQTICHRIVRRRRWRFPCLLTPPAMLLVLSLAGVSASGQTCRRAADDPNVVLVTPVPFKAKDTKLSCETEDRKLALVFMDLGSDVGLVFRSAYNTVLHANFNRNHAPTTRTDRNYGVDFGDNKVCSWSQGNDPSQCEKPPNLRGTARRTDDKWEVSLRIPKSELSPEPENGKPDNSWVTFETYDVSGTESSTIYPPGKHRQEIPRSKKLDLVYSLNYDQPRDVPLHPCWPPAPPRLSVKGDHGYENVYEGRQACVSWEVPNAQTVIITGLGQQSAVGYGCTDAGSQGTRTFHLSAPGADCPVDISVTVQVKSGDILRLMSQGDFFFTHEQYEDAIKKYREGLEHDTTNIDLTARVRRASAMFSQQQPKPD